MNSPADAQGRSPHRFLYVPTENHSVRTPGHAKVWHRVVLDSLAQHVLGEPAADLPPLLGGRPVAAAVTPTRTEQERPTDG